MKGQDAKLNYRIWHDLKNGETAVLEGSCDDMVLFLIDGDPAGDRQSDAVVPDDPMLVAQVMVAMFTMLADMDGRLADSVLAGLINGERGDISLLKAFCR